MIPQHLSISNEHLTPPEIVEASKKVLGNIDLDPASSEEGNHFINADYYFTKETDGFSKKWWGNVFLNPPGGFRGNKSSQKEWFLKLYKEWQNNRVNRAIFVAFNLEIIRHCPECLNFPICVLSKRPNYWSFNEEKQEYLPGQWNQNKTKWTNSPSHATIIVFLPSKKSMLTGYQIFSKSFSYLGSCYELNKI